MSHQLWRDSQQTCPDEIMQTLNAAQNLIEKGKTHTQIRSIWSRILNKCCFFAEFFWRCILRKQVEKGLAVILGIMSVAILLAEATLLPSVDLSLFSILIKSVGTREVLVQVDQISKRLSICNTEMLHIYLKSFTLSKKFLMISF